MINIAIVNGSPKPKVSTSEMLSNQIQSFVQAESIEYQAREFVRRKTSQELISRKISDILKADVLLIVFPLYIDSLPAPLIRVLTLIEEQAYTAGEQLPIVYAVCNCGYYEVEQTRYALQMIEHFSVRVGMRWGYGIGISCGVFIQSKGMIKDKGPTSNVYTTLRQLGEAIQSSGTKEHNRFVTPKIPRFFYRRFLNRIWGKLVKQCGIEKTSLRAIPHRNP